MQLWSTKPEDNLSDQITSLSDEIQKHNLIKEIVKYCHKLDNKGFVANHDGNITVKCGDFLLATPTAVSKGNISADIIIVLDSNGNKTEGSGKPFSEVKLHLAAYSLRDEIKAVVHAHPTFSTAYGLANLSIQPNIPEAIISLGDIIPVCEFSMPGTKEGDEAIKKALSIADVCLIPGNGVIAVGDSIEQAYLRLELVEHVIKIDYYSRKIGTQYELSRGDIELLLKKRKDAGLGPKNKNSQTSQDNNAVSKASNSQQISDPNVDRIKRLIAEEIKRALQS